MTGCRDETGGLRSGSNCLICATVWTHEARTLAQGTQTLSVSVEQARRFARGYIEVPTEEELVEKGGSPVESCGSGATGSRDSGFGPGAG